MCLRREDDGYDGDRLIVSLLDGTDVECEIRMSQWGFAENAALAGLFYCVDMLGKKYHKRLVSYVIIGDKSKGEELEQFSAGVYKLSYEIGKSGINRQSACEQEMCVVVA